MSRIDQIKADWHAAAAALAWQYDLGVDAFLQDTPVNRYEAVAAVTLPRAGAVMAPPVQEAAPGVDAVAEAVAMAEQAPTLDALAAAIAAFAHCEIRRGARNMVFSGGTPGARVMVVGDAPDREEDRAGAPFVHDKGKLFDAMFAAIGMAREGDDPLYLTCALPWKTPGDAPPAAGDLAMMRPFLLRHITLAAPDIVIAMGNDAVAALFPDADPAPERGVWTTLSGRPVLVMQNPASLLRNPAAKCEAWADLRAVRARLQEGAA